MNIIDKLFRPRLRAVARRLPENDRYPADMPVPLLAEIVFLIRDVTEDDLSRTSRALENPANAEKVLGTIVTIETIHLWALQFKCQGKSNAARQRAEYECTTAAEAEEAKRQAERWGDLGRLAGWLFWVQAKDDLGDEAWSADAGGKTLGVRTGYRIVAFQRQNPMAQLMGQFGG
jgi:hypothetical protein